MLRSAHQWASIRIWWSKEKLSVEDDFCPQFRNPSHWHTHPRYLGIIQSTIAKAESGTHVSGVLAAVNGTLAKTTPLPPFFFFFYWHVLSCLLWRAACGGPNERCHTSLSRLSETHFHREVATGDKAFTSVSGGDLFLLRVPITKANCRFHLY